MDRRNSLAQAVCGLLLLRAVAAAGDQGGWLSAPELEVPACNMDVVKASELPLEKFYELYAGKRPVLIRGGTSSWAAHSTWTREYMRNAYGEKTVAPKCSAAGIKRRDGSSTKFEKAVKLPFRTFLDQGRAAPICAPAQLKDTDRCSSTAEYDYIFDALAYVVNASEQQRLFGNLPYLREWNQYSTQLALGSAGTGLGLHDHGEAISVSIWGTRRWVVLNTTDYACKDVDEMNSWSEMGSAVWLQEVYPSITNEMAQPIIECTQRKGDVVYVPEAWHHTVLNMDEAVAISYNRRPSDGFIRDRKENVYRCK